MNFRRAIILLTTLAIVLSARTAQAQLNFTFTFTSTPAHSTVNGTVSGEILGLQNNAASAPTDIIITSAPAGLNLPNLSYDLGANGWNLSGAGDTITVTNGVITTADYQATLGTLSFFDLNYSTSNNGMTVTGLNGLEYGGENFTNNTTGFTGATYEAAPEPSTWSLLLGGLGLLGLCFRRQRAVSICKVS
jgi:hypothetical protein